MAQPFILGVDLDGVVGDHTRRFRDIMADIRGVDPESLPLERSWDFAEWDLDLDQYSAYHHQAVMDYDMLATMPVLDGAADTLWRLSNAGVWIRIITHRLYVNWSHAKAITDTATWLDRHSIPYRDLCFVGDKPEVQANAYVDDAPHNIVRLRDAGNMVIVFDQPYNRDLAGPRAHSWAELEEIVMAAVAEHSGQFAAQLPGIDPSSDRLPTASPPPQTPSGDLTLRQLQHVIERTYGTRDAERGVAASIAWLAEEFGELAQAIRKGTADDVEHEFSDVVAWVVTLANQTGIDLTKALERYRSGCPKCQASPCRCPST